MQAENIREIKTHEYSKIVGWNGKDDIQFILEPDGKDITEDANKIYSFIVKSIKEELNKIYNATEINSVSVSDILKESEDFYVVYDNDINF